MASQRFVGIDISKAKVDVHCRPDGFSAQYKRDPAGLREMSRMLKNSGVVRIVVEATGGYERTVLKALVRQELPVVLVQPRRARAFATAINRLAKTDAIDAEILAIMAEAATQNDTPWSEPRPEFEVLQSLVRRRHQLVTMITAERVRMKQAHTPLERESIRRVVDLLVAERERLDEKLDDLVRADAMFKARSAVLQSVRGVGRVTAITLLAELPELGTIDRSSITSLAGLAPMANDSGSKSGKRRIIGGRGAVRSVLYMGVVSLTHRAGIIGEFYLRLVSRGKPKKVAITACMRKLLIHLNAVMRDARLAEAAVTD